MRKATCSRVDGRTSPKASEFTCAACCCLSTVILHMKNGLFKFIGKNQARNKRTDVYA